MGSQGKSRAREPEQLVLFKQRGGKRRGAGRPPKGRVRVRRTRRGWI